MQASTARERRGDGEHRSARLERRPKPLDDCVGHLIPWSGDRDAALIVVAYDGVGGNQP
jgi:hypothetical protein